MAMALTAVGGILGAIGAMKQAKASEKAEKARQRAMQLDALRKRREVAREAVRARATALSNASSQGAAEGSALQGGYGQIGGTATRNQLAINQDETLGNKVFEANRDYAKAGGLMALGQGISSFGSVFSSQNFLRYT